MPSVLGLGESFSGKTTVSVAAMTAGGRVVSDDVVLAVPGEGGGVFAAAGALVRMAAGQDA